MSLSKNSDELIIAKKMLRNALKMEESLAKLIHTEVKLLIKNANGKYSYEEIRKINKSIKYTLLSMTLLDDRIETALELYKIDSLNSNDKTQ